MLLAAVALILVCGARAAIAALSRLPEENMTVPQIISYWGYPAEVHNVTTTDGYILTLHRIPYGKSGLGYAGTRPVIYIQHGLEASSATFVANLPTQSFAFIAADSGFDVWLGNSRGNLYSLGHKTFDSQSNEDQDYWAFSWDQMAKYDLEAMTNRILAASGASQLYYVGHSQGTLMMFSKLTADAGFSRKIKKFFALAPIGQCGNARGFFGQGLRSFYLPLQIAYELAGNGPLLAENTPFIDKSQLDCLHSTRGAECIDLINKLGGVSTQLNETRLRLYLAELSAGTSVMNILHWMQIVQSGKQQMFNWGTSERNIAKYGQTTPPVYDISKITTDVYLYWSEEDLIAVARDVREGLLARLPQSVIKGNVTLRGFSHFDFVWGLRAAKELYAPILQIAHNDFISSR